MTLRKSGSNITNRITSSPKMAPPASPKLHPPAEKQSKKYRFKQQQSAMDFEIESEFSKGPHRGWFNLFTIGIVLYMALLQYDHITRNGTLIGLTAAKDWFTSFDMFPAWLALVALAFVSFFLQKAVTTQTLSLTTATVYHAILQITMFVGATIAAIYGAWPLVPTIFYLAETLILSMKIHSYWYTNRELQLNPNASDSTVKWPDNVTLWNFFDFLIVPPLVYEPEYPRTSKFRPTYLISKLLAFIALWTVLHLIASSYLEPGFAQLPETPFVLAVAKLSLPSLLFGVLLFYAVFDAGCNGIAELTRFADREFYQDWWNSTTFGEFARKWNRPVQEWLLRHVYLQTQTRYKVSPRSAMIITFLFSALVHEYFMCVSLRMFRPWLSAAQIAQLPLIMCGGSLKGTRAGNFIFWLSMMTGLPLITIAYAREYYFRERSLHAGFLV